mgnify:CR=1 FL=1
MKKILVVQKIHEAGIKLLKNNPKLYTKLINLEKNKGKGAAVREGLKSAVGDYILFQDSDLELDTDDSYAMYKIIKNDK